MWVAGPEESDRFRPSVSEQGMEKGEIDRLAGLVGGERAEEER